MKYNCDKTKEMMSLYIDDELEKREKQYVAEHLLNCANCKKEYDELKIIINELSNLPMQPLPLDFKEKLHNRLVMESKEIKKNSFNWRVYSPIAAGVILTILIGTGYYQRFSPIENAYVNDAKLNYEDKTADVTKNIEEKQQPTEEKTPIKNVVQKKKEVAITPKPIIDAPIIPNANNSTTSTPEVAVNTPKPQTQNVALNSEKVAVVETTPAPAPAEKISGGGGGSHMAAMSARSFAEIVYKTANVKVDNFIACADEINKKFGSVTQDGKIILYISDTELEEILTITKKYNGVIIYDNVTAKNPTNKCIITIK